MKPAELNEQERALLTKEKRTEVETGLLCARALDLSYAVVRLHKGTLFRGMQFTDAWHKGIEFDDSRLKWHVWMPTIADIWLWVESEQVVDIRTGIEPDFGAWFAIGMRDGNLLQERGPTKLDALKNLLIKMTWP